MTIEISAKARQQRGSHLMNTSRLSPRSLRIAMLGGSLLWATGAAAQSPADDCADICPGMTTPCTVGAAYDVVDGSDLDCENIDLTVGAAGVLKVTDGSYTLRAKSLLVANSGIIKAADGGTPTGDLAIDIVVTNDVTLRGTVVASAGRTAGSISIEAGGNITIENSGTGIEAQGTGGGDGGTIRVKAEGNFTTYKNLLADGAGTAQTVGGTISVEAGGDILLHNTVRAAGYGGGEGGTVSLEAGDTVSIDGGGLNVTGNGQDSAGGGISIEATDVAIDGQTLTVRGGVNAAGSGAFGGGISIRAETVDLLNTTVLDGRGAEGSGLEGGAVSIEADDWIRVGGSAAIYSRATASNGEAGDVVLRAPAITLESGATIDASGGASSGSGGEVLLDGCEVDVNGASTINVTGFHAGTIKLAALGGRDNPSAPSDTVRLHVSELATISAAAPSGGENGTIELIADHVTPGACSNNQSLECSLDTACTAGCETGDCEGASQDTDGVLSQFDVAPEGYLARGAGNCAY